MRRMFEAEKATITAMKIAITSAEENNQTYAQIMNLQSLQT